MAAVTLRSRLPLTLTRQLSTARDSQTPKNYSNPDFQFLERSAIPTYHFQKSLPRLPIPLLPKTIERYLNGVRPIVPETWFRATSKIAEEFRDGVGKNLHEELVNLDKQNRHTSYISEPWYDMYLKARDPIVINFNPFMTFNFDPDTKYNDQLTRATNMVVSTLRFKRSLDSSVLRPEVFHLNPKKSDTATFRRVTRMLPPSLSWYGAYFFKAFPLDMSQYSHLFGTARIPKLQRDAIVNDRSSKHLLVMRNGHMFSVKVLDDDGSILPPTKIHAALKQIQSQKLESPEYSVATLTSENRDVWAKVRIALLESGNESQLKLIDSAIFCLCLDDIKTTEPQKLIRSFLHGTGKNRWFDKSYQLIIHADGLASINFEHSWGDGVAVLRMMEDVYGDSCKNHWVHPDTDSSSINVSGLIEKIEFKLTPAVKTAIGDAESKFKKLVDSLSFSPLEYTDMNRNYWKRQKLSPDSLMQLAIQMAYFRQNGKPTATYESCSTAAFKHGRTETMRPATMDTKNFVDKFHSNQRPSNGELRGMIEQCSKTHGELVKLAAMGQGFDRHLFALKSLAAKKGNELPAFFQDQSYLFANQYVLSTSTLSTETIILGGFGPVVSNGYGIGYFVGEKRVGCLISAYEAHRNGSEFVQCLKGSLDDLRTILEATGPK